MSLKLNCNSFTEGFYKLNNYLFFENAYDYERGGVTAHKFDVTMVAASPACDLNLHDLNYTSNKWNMINNLYIDPQEVGVFLGRIQHYHGHSKHKLYIPDIAMQFKTRRNVSGACLLNLSLGYNREKWRCSVTSRASELTCRWPMDLIFINVLLRTLSEELGIDYTKIEVTWHMISTYQSITSMPYFIVMAGKEDWFEKAQANPDELSAWQKYTLKRYLKCYKGDAYTAYRVQRRPMEAYRMLKGEMERKQLLWTEDLSIRIVPFKGVLEEDYDEVDILHVDMGVLKGLIQEAKDNDLWGKGGYR
jgi:hypothetical protein